ncbi:MAG: NAD(P)-dependent glycerol-3-phosphate dehydrogenase [Candidatus Melainabacteria bacterium]|nr:NAD(P)-dependent glycerol-3-phosphate dehydrogenase [Candidatus Melainabacteria bacterium]
MKSRDKLNIAVLGAGSWGGTLAYHLSKKNYNVLIWTFSTEEFKNLSQNRTLLRPAKLKFNKHIKITNNISDIKDSEVIIIAVPGKAFESTIKRVTKLKLKPNCIFISATKGIDSHCHRPSQLLTKYLKKYNFAILSGPNIALDVLSNSPAISVIACKNKAVGLKLQSILSTKNFRIYTNTDATGIEIAGALKNVIAIASGMCDGFGFNISSKAALISRGLIEIGKVAVAEGAKSETLLSAAGIGDLIATCCSPNSRNYKVGYALAKGKKLKNILHELGEVAEGVETVKSMHKLVKKHKIKTPIADAVYEIIVKNKNPKTVLKQLLNRPLPKQEIEL